MDKLIIVVTVFGFLLARTLQFSDELDDSSDDVSCIGEDKLPCWSGGCFTHDQFCDGIIDCDDASDENFCSLNMPDSEVCKETHQFSCADGNGCIPNSWLCNNNTDCDDGSDELNCTQTPIEHRNTTCRGFQCLDGKCISNLWLCDGVYDCQDRSDEYSQELCRHITSSRDHQILDGTTCTGWLNGERSYQCLDSSYCLPASMMCDGMPDCRDATDEGPFCDHWHTMCNNFTCLGNNSACSPDRHGPTCICTESMILLQYNYSTGKCEDVNECVQERPSCSQTCVNHDGRYACECDDGYTMDRFGYLCYATGPEAMLFFSTSNDIRYLKVRSKEVVVIASGIKKAHGLSYDGTYVYWVESAQGHQAIFKAQLGEVKETKQVLVGLGLEDPGDIAVDYLGGNIYFSDSERGIISACRADGSICTTIKTQAKHPRFVTLDPKNGRMYWADWQSRAVIMTARMDGSHPEVLVDTLRGFASGLAIDSPNDRLYFVDKTIKVVTIHGKQVYSLFEEPIHQPYSVAVFENTVYWSDWTSNTLQTMDKLHGAGQKRNILLKVDTPVFGMHIYHPVLMNATSNPCSNNVCSHLCFVTSNTSHVCACPDGMEIQNSNTCVRIGDYRAKYLVVAGEQLFTRIQYDELGNPESHATHFDIERVQAMAYDNYRDSLYLYDGQLKTIRYINMSEFNLGVTHPLVYSGLENVVDMDYDYATDNLYILDAGRRLVEVFSLRTQRRAHVYQFGDDEVPISLCVMPDYGRMMVAMVESEQHNIIHIDSIGLNGEGRKHIIMNNLKGPHVRLRYVQHLDNVFISDESNGVIEYIHPDGTGRENYRELLTTVTSLAVADNYVFWTDRRTPRLFWSDIHDTTQKTRRIELALFPAKVQLLIQATSSPPDHNDPLLYHACLRNVCSDVCVQEVHDHAHASTYLTGHKCLCPPTWVMKDGKCTEVVTCGGNKVMCHKSNVCILKAEKCDGKTDCPLGEDEEGCSFLDPNNICLPDEIFCNGLCLKRKDTTMCNGKEIDADTSQNLCTTTEYQCANSSICIARSQLCDRSTDCPSGDDELASECDTFSCYETEFMCASGSCIMKSFRCDGERDCNDGSDEMNCANKPCAPGMFQCRNKECIELNRQCDGHQDCFDLSDEEDCEDQIFVEIVEVKPRCAAWEYACEHDPSICLPYTARCNKKQECPGGSDESGCQHCVRGMFECSQQLTCIAMRRVCDRHTDCLDGSDETPDACRRVNRTSHLFPSHSRGECTEGYTCSNGQCIEWHQVCDNHTDCLDGTDEHGLCSQRLNGEELKHDIASEGKCMSNIECIPTPLGVHCKCPPGCKQAPQQNHCEDINECEEDVCSQECYNMRGSFRCGCYRGYTLRSDHRSCKAIKGNLSILYISGHKVRSIANDGRDTVEFTEVKMSPITDVDYDYRQNKLYVTSAAAGKLLEVNGTHNVMTVTNVGVPTKLAVDWVTGNVYFVDSTPLNRRMRVCNVRRKRCAVLQKLPSDAKVTALIVDPSSRLMFYCVNRELDSVVWSASLSGRLVTDLATVQNCTGLAVDSFKKRLYVAETGPDHIVRIDYYGHSFTKVLSDQTSLQSPNSLAIFENHVYFSNSNRLGRCLLYGRKTCESYISRVVSGNKFVVRHDSVQRDDIADECEGMVCGNVCALDEEGPVCICDDGTMAKSGDCPTMERNVLPLFNGWSYQELQSAHHVSFSIITAVMVLAVLYLCVFVYYHFVYKPKKDKASNYAEVRYQNSTGDTEPFTTSAPTIQITTGGNPAHEFVNPLQYVRNMWYSSFRKHTRPTRIDDVAVTMPNSPPQQDLSDTESDLDDKENKRFFKYRL